MPATETIPTISIIVPARNEEASLADCLQSLVAQSGVDFEIIVVDDHSTDRTHEIATSFPTVTVIEAGPLPVGWTGKNNAVTTGARQARGQWLLFTDADTVHLPGSLVAALKEAQENGAELLSYSPEQIAVTFWEMATLPVVFAELARQYSPVEGQRPRVSRRRRQRPVHPHPPRDLRRRRRPRRRRPRHPRRRRSRPRRQILRPQDFLPLRRQPRPHPHVPQLRPTPRRLD
jgi:glycosyltransferase involved in cell wall biosynthesis